MTKPQKKKRTGSETLFCDVAAMEEGGGEAGGDPCHLIGRFLVRTTVALFKRKHAVMKKANEAQRYTNGQILAAYGRETF